MKRRDLFKCLAGMIAASIVAPIAKLLPLAEPQIVTLSHNATIDIGPVDLALTIDEFSERYLVPAIKKLEAESFGSKNGIQVSN